MRHDLTTVSALTITTPGPYTDQEGACSFKGWAGQDFESMLVKQTTYVNNYSADKSGHTGRWIVVDYNLSSTAAYGTVFGIQMMDIDLGTATDDLYAFDAKYNMTMIHQGQVYIGLAPYSGNTSYRHGYNAGQMSPDIFDGEDKIFSHMSAPNNMTASALDQNWYMDQVVRIPAGTFPGQFRFAFVIVVGEDPAELREAYDDAKAGLSSLWNGSYPTDWVHGTVDLSAAFSGPFWPSSGIQVIANPTAKGVPQTPVALDHVVGSNRTVNFTANTSDLVPTTGTVSFDIVSFDPWGFPARTSPFTIYCDNEKPTVSFGEYPAWQNKNYQVIAVPDDDDGSGIFTTYISANDEPYRASTIATIQTEGADNQVKAYAVDAVGNRGDTITISGLGLDKTAPALSALHFIPSDVTEDTAGAVKISVDITDPLSGVNTATVSFRYGIGTASSQWAPMTRTGSTYEGSPSVDWNAAQGRDIVVEVKATDLAGNTRTASSKETVDPVNDAPSFTMSLTGSDWESGSAIIEFSGSDPDGDPVTFEIQYRTEGGDWNPPMALLKRLSTLMYSLDVPDIPFEGLLYVRASVSDAIVSVEIPQSSIRMDRKAPKIECSIDPDDSYWSKEARQLRITATDTGAGLDKIWFDLDGARIDSGSLNITREGVFDVKAHASDRSGNEAKVTLPEFGIDWTGPEIVHVAISPTVVRETSDITLTWDMVDRTSGISIYDSTIQDGSRKIVPDQYITIDGDTISARFSDNDLSGGRSYPFFITVTDRAGNTKAFEGTLMVNETYVPPPLNITCPDSVEVGKTLELSASGKTGIILHILYPGRGEDWIIAPVRTEGELHEFSLDAPYAWDRPIEAWFEYKAGDENLTYPSPHLSIVVTGAKDEDGDGLEDSWEDRYGYDDGRKDKASLDRDGDGLDAISEMRNLTDPSFWDTDGDGMDDSWEARMGTLPFIADAGGDIDHDGYSNSLERIRKTDPRDPGSVPGDLPPTPWYWMVLITLAMLAVIVFFAYQLLSRRKLEKELSAMDEESWDEGH